MHTQPRLLLAFFCAAAALHGAMPSWQEELAWFAAVRSGKPQAVEDYLEAYPKEHPDRSLDSLLNSVEPERGRSAFFIACLKADAPLARKLFALGADPLLPTQDGCFPPYGVGRTLAREVGEEIYTQAQARMRKALAQAVGTIMRFWLRQARLDQAGWAWEAHITRHCLLPKLKYRDLWQPRAPMPNLKALIPPLSRLRVAQLSALLTLGVENIDVTDISGYTLLHNCSTHGQVALAELLIAQGASLDKPTHAGATPLWLATLHRRSEMVRLLLARGADPRIADGSGHTPLFWARKYNHQELIALLEEALMEPPCGSPHKASDLSPMPGGLSSRDLHSASTSLRRRPSP